MDFKSKIRIKQQKKKKMLERKQLKLTEIKNYDNYFDFAGNWKSRKSYTQKLGYKDDESQLSRLLNLEYQLNHYYPLDPISDIITVSNISYQRYEKFDTKTLLHGKKSKIQ